MCMRLNNRRAKKRATMVSGTVMVVGIDESEESQYALQWTLQHWYNKPSSSSSASSFKLIIVHTKSTAFSAAGLGGTGAIDMMPHVDSDLRKIAGRVIERSKQMCESKHVSDALFEVVEGDARNVLCDAVDRHHADILVVGSHGHGKLRRAILGSVSDYCAHHANCTVMIVKKPKPKN